MAEQSISTPADPTRVDPRTGMVGVTIRYFAAARAAAGVQQERLTLLTTDPGHSLSGDPAQTGDRGRAVESTVGSVLDAAVDRHGPGLARVLQRCSYLLDEVAVHGRQTPVRDGQVLDVLPPFAGGCSIERSLPLADHPG